MTTEITINGKRAYLYKVGIGSYSDYSEEWWYHEREMTAVSMIEALLAALPAEEAKAAEHLARRNAKAQELFGCDADQIGWKYRGERRVMTTPKGKHEEFELYLQTPEGQPGYDLRLAVLVAAGFEALAPQAEWSTEPTWRYEPNRYQQDLQWELADAKAREAGENRRPS